jgi:hypothetical protein
MRPDPSGSLADGVLIQGSVRGRVFGMPILKIDTTLALSPAQIHSSATQMRTGRTPGLSHSTPARAVGGRGLADAVKAIAEAAEQLANSRKVGG